MLANQILRYIAFLIVGLSLLACGGDNSDEMPPPEENNPPTFTSALEVEVEENTSDGFYTAQAVDPDGDTLSFSISGGDDAQAFVIDQNTGVVSFDQPADFEVPTDTDSNNIYHITISVNDSQGTNASMNLQVTVIDQQQTAQVRRVGQGFTQPLYAIEIDDGSGRMLIVQKNGRIRLLDPSTGNVEPVDFLDVSTSISTAGEGGLLGLVLAPDFSTSGQIYVNLTNAAGDTEIRGYRTFVDRLDQIDPTTENLILAINQPASNHNAGWLGFDRNGLLIIPTGDGGGSGDPDNLAQDPNSLLGKVLRIDISGDDFPIDDTRDYAIPQGNTFPNGTQGRAEIYAVGLRNPFRASFDPFNGDLLLGDVGQNAIEEIDRLPMNDSSFNFGWPLREGTRQFKGPDEARFTPPVTQYTQGTGPTQGRSVTGGYVYTGPVETLQGEYIFADFITGNIWSLPANELVNGSTIDQSQFTILTSRFSPDVGSLDNIASFGVDQQNNLYIVSLNGGIYRLEAAN